MQLSHRMKCPPQGVLTLPFLAWKQYSSSLCV